MSKLIVALSPFFAKETFFEEVSGISFDKSKTSSIYPYDISNESSLDGIRKAVRLNILIVLEGQLADEVPVKEEEPKVEEPKVEVPVEEVAPVVEDEPKEEAPKSKVTKKATK